MSLLRRIRGIVGTALTWAVGWGVLGAAGYAIASLVWGLPPDLPRSEVISTGALFLTIYGFVAGTAFSLVLLVAERRRTLHQLTLRRIAAWGGVGSMLMIMMPAMSITWSLANGLAVLAFGLLGAGSAAGSLAVARRGLLAPPGEQSRIGMAAEP